MPAGPLDLKDLKDISYLKPFYVMFSLIFFSHRKKNLSFRYHHDVLPYVSLYTGS